MYSSFYKQLASAILSLPIVALILFVVVFAGLVVRALTKPKADVDQAARLPLADDASNGGNRS